MDSSKLRTIFLLTVSAFVALYLGIAAATAQFTTVLWVVGVGGLAICVLMGTRIWLLLPLMTALSLKLPIPGNFSTGLIAQGIVIGFCFLLFLMRRLPFRIQMTELEFWCLGIILMVVQAYMRNPVGLNIFGAESVGAKPYALFVGSTMTAAFISILLVNPKDLRWIVRLTIIGTIMNFVVGIIAVAVPSAGRYLAASFTDAAPVEEDPREQIDRNAAGRITFIGPISGVIARWVASRVSPLTACFHPLWAPLILISLAFAAFSGFRSQIAIVGLTYVVGILYRGGFPQFLIASVGGILAITVLALVNATAPLPPNVQRSLSFLPGTWEQRYRDDAAGSTEWRMEIWKEALGSDQYIRNKWVGDGLGMNAEELKRGAYLEELRKKGLGGFDVHRENILISGDYHSGPVQTIKVMGGLGLIILLAAKVRLAVHAHRQIRRAKGTEWFPVALFICIPFVWEPIFWTFIFGDFSGGASNLLLGTAWIRMLEKNLPLPEYRLSRHVPYAVSGFRQQPVPAPVSARG